ncbi:AMP-binding protein [Streptomyces sp. DSM 41029]
MYAVDELKDVPALPAAFETAAAAAADRTALECGKRVLTYRELNAAANRLARRLRSSEGVTAGSRVAIHMSRSVELYVALLAVLKLGGVVVPLNPAHPVAVRRSAAEEAQPVLTLRDVPAGLGSVTAERDVHELVAASGSLPDGNLAEAVDPESTAFILFTSGSTGRPKGVLIPHRAIARVADHNGHAVVLPDDCFLQTSPYSFAASTTEIWLSLLHGARLVVPPPQLPSLPELARLITEHGVTFLNLPCGLFNLLVDGHPEALDGVRSVIVSGGFPSPEHLSRALRAVGGAVHNAYGCTENSALTAVRALTEEDVRRQVFPVGRPLPGVGLHVLRPDLAPCDPGEVGELCLSGAGLTHGYLEQPKLTAEKFPEHAGTRLLRTGDMARLTPEGEVVLVGPDRPDGEDPGLQGRAARGGARRRGDRTGEPCGGPCGGRGGQPPGTRPVLHHRDRRAYDVHPIEAYLRREKGAYLDPWHDRLKTAYVDTLADLGVTKDLSDAEFLAAMERPKQVDPVLAAVLSAIKATVKGGVGKLRERPQGKHYKEGEPWPALTRPTWRPDIRAAVISKARVNMHRKLRNMATMTGLYPLAVLSDCVVCPAPGGSPLDFLPYAASGRPQPGAFRLGSTPGLAKTEGVQELLWAVDLMEKGLNPARRIKGDGHDAVLDEGE